MHVRFVEAGNGANWGKFLVARHSAEEWLEPERLPGAQDDAPEVDGISRLRGLLAGRGWGPGHLWVLDLQTGEGAMFLLGGLASADLDRLYQYAAAGQEGWWDRMPRVLTLPYRPAELYGYRRPGPPAR